MVFVVIFIAFFLLLSFTIKNKFLRSMIQLFNVIWIALFVLCITKNYQLSDFTYFMLGILITFCNIGVLLAVKRDKLADNFSLDKMIADFDKYVLRNKWIVGYVVLSLIVILFYSVKYTILIRTLGALQARIIRNFAGPLFSTFELLFYNYIISPVRFICIFVMSGNLLAGKLKLKENILYIVVLVLYCYMGGARTPCMLLVVSLVITSIFKRYLQLGTDRQARKTFLILFSIIIVCFVAMTYITAYRRAHSEFTIANLYNNFYILIDQIIDYNVMPLKALDVTYSSGLLENYLFLGRAVIWGGIEQIYSHMFTFADINYQAARYIVGEITNAGVIINEIPFNALFTAVFWFFADMGILGVAAYSFFYAFIVGRVMYRSIKDMNIFYFAIMLHLLYFFLTLNLNWAVTAPDSTLYLLALLYLGRKVKKNAIN